MPNFFSHHLIIKPKIARVAKLTWERWLYFGTLISMLMSCRGGGSIPQGPGIPGSGNYRNGMEIIVDDFLPQPYQGEQTYFYNRLEGDRGSVNEAEIEWGKGQARLTIAPGQTWGGGYLSLNHPIREGRGIDFSAILPAQVKEAFQSRVTGLRVVIGEGSPGNILRLELKDGSHLRWAKETRLKGGAQEVSFSLPRLETVNQLVWVLAGGKGGDYVLLRRVALQVETSIEETAWRAFTWSFGMLLENWNPATGLVRDQARFASGEMDAIQATGALAAATAQAEQLGVIDRVDAIGIVSTIEETLLNRLPRQGSLWAHWVRVSEAGEISQLEGTEWSSVDTVIAALGLLEAQQGLGMDTSQTEQFLKAIEWENLLMAGGISHGYTAAGELIPYAWDTFGGESWLVALAYASARGSLPALAYPNPPTANGSGFIDELAWLFVPAPEGRDAWGTDWQAYRQAAAEAQVNYYPSQKPGSCFAKLGLFGLSAGEVPDPARVEKGAVYQAFGVGGRFEGARDTSRGGEMPVVTPHYSAMVASLRGAEALRMWAWLIEEGHFSPLTNVESLTFLDPERCTGEAVTWNQTKGSWNLALQTLGWGNYLAEQAGEAPILWQAAQANAFLRAGYRVLQFSAVTATFPPEPALTETPRPAIAEPTQIVPPEPAGEGFKISQGPELSTRRSWHTATRLLNGQVLLVGGSRSGQEFLSEVALFDPQSGKSSLAASLLTPRHEHTAVLLRDGRVLVVGGYNRIQGWLEDAEIYDPVSNTWKAVPPLFPHGVQHTATLMQDGRVLVAGGCIGSGVCTEKVEIFNPKTDQWMAVRSFESYRASHAAVCLQDGRVLVAGGAGPDLYPAGGEAALYDAQTDTWTATGAMVSPRIYAQAVLLADGKILLAGGMRLADQEALTLSNSVEIFDPATNAWKPAASMAQRRYFHSLVALRDGRVLAVGGAREYDTRWNEGSFVSEIEIYSLLADEWITAGTLPNPRVTASAVLLDDGRVWLAGGQMGEQFWSDSWFLAPGRADDGQFARNWTYQRECEFPADASVGQAISRSNASGLTVHGQFGVNSHAPWGAQSGYVRYANITIPQDLQVSIRLRYSKYSSSGVLIYFSLDEEAVPRASFDPINQGNWNLFAWSEPIGLGVVKAGVHTLVIATEGQQYGVADLDMFALEGVEP